jgi:predicted pyridoxine 5'-phosphate oxidase superfamily flavin-nucleotide-binding protein
MFHAGERSAQRRAGLLPDDVRGSAAVGAAIPPVAAQFLGQQRMLVIGAADEAGAVWASLLTGPAGTVATLGARTIVAHTLPGAGDPLAGAFDTERDIGMLALDPARRRRVRVNGKARRAGRGLVVHTEQVYANCAKYIQERHLVTGGANVPAGPVSVTTGLDAGQQGWIAEADTFFVATHAAGVGSDTSHRGGNPGFVKVAGSRRLSWPDYVGNSMYMTLGNLELDPRCGLLFLDWERGHTLQLTGRASLDWDPRRAATVPGAQRHIDFHVDKVVQIAGGNPQRWSLGSYSRFNPA